MTGRPSRTASAALRRLGVTGVLVALPLAVSVSCKKKGEAELEFPTGNSTAAATQPTTPPPPPDAGATAPADAAPAPADAAPAGPTPLDLLTQQSMAKELEARRPKEAKWPLKASGEPFGAVLPEGGVVEQLIQVNPHKCIGVIAQGGPGIVELDIQIQALPLPGIPLPLPSTTFAVDNTGGPQAAVNPCVKNVWPVAFSAKVVVKATRGSGAALAQVYSD